MPMGELRTRKDYCLILDSKFDFSSKSCEIQFKGALDDIPPHLGFGTRTDVPRWKTTAFSVEKVSVSVSALKKGRKKNPALKKGRKKLGPATGIVPLYILGGRSIFRS